MWQVPHWILDIFPLGGKWLLPQCSWAEPAPPFPFPPHDLQLQRQVLWCSVLTPHQFLTFRVLLSATNLVIETWESHLREIQKKTRWSPFRNSRRRGWPRCFQSTAENSYHFCTSVLWLISLEDEPQRDLEGEGTQGWPCLFPSSRKPSSFSGLPYFIKPLLHLCPEPQALVVLSE